MRSIRERDRVSRAVFERIVESIPVGSTRRRDGQELIGNPHRSTRRNLMSRQARSPLFLIPVVGLLVVVGASHAAASLPGAAETSSSRLALAGTLTFNAELGVRYPPTTCPTGTPNSIACFARTGSATIRGLGNATESYPYFVEDFPPGCAADQVRVLPAAVRLSVAGKGQLELRLGGSGCLTRVPPEPVQGEETFTITGGSGRYAGASGGGTITHESGGPPSWRGKDTWTGTLVVPGLDFDLTAPVLTGARNKTVRAPRGAKGVRVEYSLSAQDEIDGAVGVACRPRSGGWFRIGQTRVGCSAMDTSGNGSTGTFIVTVKRAR
jgi:HYR domain